MIHRRRNTAFTLIELLVVIAIVGVLVALTLVAVQAARESARTMTCKNNLKQIGLAVAAHHVAHRHLPTGGWGWGWQGDPDRGFGALQTGGWPYALLPFLDEEPLRRKGSRAPWVQKKTEIREVASTPIPVFHCPSRRTARPYPFLDPRAIFFNIDRPQVLARSDYAANTGDIDPGIYGSGPPNFRRGDEERKYEWPKDTSTGICSRRSTVRNAQVSDGLSKTYLVGEKHLKPEHYETGAALNDDQGLFVGYDRDTLRITALKAPPRPDVEGGPSDQVFGSAHSGGFHMVLCDGAVRLIAYEIDPETHRRLGNRADGMPVSEF
jgi:prepilin-type N-terminal cleavage/methylation domain-containing protein